MNSRDTGLLASRVGLAGAALGVMAGGVQWAFGAEIPDWTGNKLHPVQLGIITIVLSLVAAAASLAARGMGDRSRGEAVLVVLGLLVPAGICFTTVGALWYLPGLLLLAAAALSVSAAPGRGRPPSEGDRSGEG